MRAQNPTVLALLATLVAFVFARPSVQAQSPYSSSNDFAKYAMKLRESALLKLEPQVFIPTTTRPSLFSSGGKYPWKEKIVTTVFWVGELPTQNNPVPNTASSWDPNWTQSFGGFDNPDPNMRRNFLPIGFIPKENPFYVALPYNDVTRGTTKPEAPHVIPWFKEAYKQYGKSVVRNRWVAIRKGTKICYAQWSDCGPFRTDHWEYVFGNERPRPNLNKGAGLDVSPAVRDFLGMSGVDVTDWRFVDFHEVPPGPWALYGSNNEFVVNRDRSTEKVASSQGGRQGSSAASSSPKVITR